ncbi:hypothetical protein L1887_05614 [Cichorium endivia]|nr:hypothetical protein L1887_05614 [Cichorium endivia]
MNEPWAEFRAYHMLLKGDAVKYSTAAEVDEEAARVIINDEEEHAVRRGGDSGYHKKKTGLRKEREAKLTHNHFRVESDQPKDLLLDDHGPQRFTSTELRKIMNESLKKRKPRGEN